MSYAGFWKRFAATIIDSLLIMIAWIIIGLLIIVMVTGGIDDFSVFDDMGFKLGGIIFSWIYYAVMESSPMQGTLGKMALSIKVTDLKGTRVGFGKATGRYFGQFISGLILQIGYIMVAFTQKKQGLHDMMAGCLVVNK